MKTLSSIRTIIVLGSLLLHLTAFSTQSLAAAGDVDLSFDPGSCINGAIYPEWGIPPVVRTVVPQPDGKVLIAGLFTTVKGLQRRSIARLNADGSGDATFDAGPNFNSVWALALQPDGKVLVAHDSVLSRLLADGSPDPSFLATVGQIVNDNGGGYGSVYAIAVQPDGRILIGGYFPTSGGPNVSTGVARLNTDGSVDASFNTGAGYRTVWALTLQPDGKILIGDHGDTNIPAAPSVVRLHANGSVDNSFNSAVTGKVGEVVVQPDGKVLIGGDNFTKANGTTLEGIARLNANGSLDSSFNAGSLFHSSPSIALQSNGKVLIAESSRRGIDRLNANGSLDASFDRGTVEGVSSVVVDSNGTVLIGGSFTRFNGIIRNCTARLTPNGSLDGGFNPGSGLDDTVAALEAQSDGKVLIGGRFSTVNDLIRPGIARLNPNGSGDGNLTTPYAAGAALSRVDSLASQADGKVLIIGEFPHVYATNLVRLNADGSLDSGFHPDFGDPSGYPGATVIALQSDGKVLVGGYTGYAWGNEGDDATYIPFLNRLNADGSRDAGFNPDLGFAAGLGVKALVVQPDGRVLVAAEIPAMPTTSRRGLARLNTDGSLDGSFDLGGGAFDISALALQADGKVLIVGGFTSTNGILQQGIARLHANGSMDNSFAVVAGAPEISSLALQSNGKVLIGGGFTSINGTARNRIARLHAGGSLDTSFNPGTGADGRVRSIALQADGNVLIAGDFLTVNGALRPYVARLYGGALSPPSFAGWIANFGLSGVADADPDHDGLASALEYILGGNPAQPSPTPPLPAASFSDGSMLFIFPRLDASETPDVILTVESGSDLVTWPDVFTIGPDTAASSPGVTILENGTAPDTITVAIPAGPGNARFARLKAVVAP